MLELHGVSKHFGGVRAVDGVDLTVARGEILGLIGPNGSGKSTIVNLICGLFPLTSGRIVFNGADITLVPMHARVTCGVARTFQNIRLFGQLTVWQNLWAAQNSAEQRRQNFARRWFGGFFSHGWLSFHVWRVELMRTTERLSSAGATTGTAGTAGAGSTAAALRGGSQAGRASSGNRNRRRFMEVIPRDWKAGRCRS